MVAWGLLGVKPLAPGFSRILVAPQPGPLKRLRAVVPTRAGPVRVELMFVALCIAAVVIALLFARVSRRRPELRLDAPSGK